MEQSITIRQIATDRFQLVFRASNRTDLRILQITDTHFGIPEPGHVEKDQKTFRAIEGVVARERPDFIVHTGDFVNNDKPGAVWDAVDFMNSLGLSWKLILGNHDVGSTPECLTTEEYRKKLENAAFGYFDRGGCREYAFRLDVLLHDEKTPRLTLFCFDSGHTKPLLHVSDSQREWFGEELERDRSEGVDCPCLAMIHVPVVEFHQLVESGEYDGCFGEKVWYETDTGKTFAALKSAERVRAVFSGHDHKNDYHGVWDGIELVYGRCTGWGGYGDCERGGRLIEVDLETGAYKHRVVAPPRS